MMAIEVILFTQIRFIDHYCDLIYEYYNLIYHICKQKSIFECNH